MKSNCVDILQRLWITQQNLYSDFNNGKKKIGATVFNYRITYDFIGFWIILLKKEEFLMKKLGWKVY